MDILHLVDRLEELFNEGRHIPLTHQVAVDEERILEIIDQMRVSIPEEVRQAKDIQARRDRIMAQAQEEAARTVELARKKAAEMTEREAVAQAAQSHAEKIVAQAHYDADGVRADADAYVMERLLEMEAELNRILNQVHNGINKLKAGQDENAPGAPA